MYRRPHVFVAGSTNPNISKEYNIAAQKIGKEIYNNKYTLVFDGCFGLPGVAAMQVIEGKESYSENILIYASDRFSKFPYEWIMNTEGQGVHCEKQSDVTRKLIEESDYLIFMKGNTGTLVELFYSIDTKKNKEHEKGIIILNIEHQWDSLLSLLDTLNVPELYKIVETPEQAMEYIKDDLNRLRYKTGTNFWGREYYLSDEEER